MIRYCKRFIIVVVTGFVMKIKMENLLNSDVRLLARASYCVVLVFCCHLALHRATHKVFLISKRVSQ